MGEEEPTVEKEAAFWFARLRSDDLGEEDRARFSRWLTADPRHADAYADYQDLWSALDDVALAGAIPAMREEALSLARTRAPLPWRRLSAIAATVAVLVLGGLLFLRPPGLQVQSAEPFERAAVETAAAPTLYRTAVGERSTVALNDGSVVELNTDSVVRVDYSGDRRSLHLLQGQALFRVAHDRDRPFVVEAGDQRITALGTMFDVWVGEEETRVTLIEGSIAVEREAGRTLFPSAPESRRLKAGEVLVAAEQQPFVVRVANVQKTVSWRSGRVIFADEPLDKVIEEINRYSVRKIVLGEPGLADLKVSGNFKAGSAERFVAALEVGFPVDGEMDPQRGVIVLRNR